MKEIKKMLEILIFNEDVSNLSKGTHKRIECICPMCKEIFSSEYRTIVKKNNSLCRKCSAFVHGTIKKHNSLDGLKILDFYFVRLLQNDIVEIKCTVCNNTKNMSMKGFKKGVSHKMCGKDLKMRDTHFYRIWANMRTRTTNKNYEKWEHYGGKDINSDCWKYFVDFHKDMFESYKTHIDIYGEYNTTLDRIDNSKGYNLANCRWATRLEQAGNKTNANICLITKNNNSKVYTNLKEYCTLNNIPYTMIISNLKKSSDNEYYHNKSKTHFKRINQTTIESIT